MLPLLTVVALFQDVVLARVAVLGGRPDLVFLVVVVWAFLRGSTEGAIWAFIGGLLLDALSGGPFGCIALSLLVVAILVGRQWGRELGSNLLQLALLVLVGCFTYHVLMLLILKSAKDALPGGYSIDHVTLQIERCENGTIPDCPIGCVEECRSHEPSRDM